MSGRDRQLYIVAYDIRDPTRWRAVYRAVRGFGERIQYSVFRCALTPVQVARLRGMLEVAIAPREDQVLLIRLGPADSEDTWDAIVVGQALPSLEKVVRIL